MIGCTCPVIGPRATVAGSIPAIYDNIGPAEALIVDQNHPGTYVEDGSETRPFKTIAAAIAARVAQTALILYPGIYNENFVPWSGKFDLIGPYGRDNTIITSAVDTLAGTSLTDDIRIEGVTLITTTVGSHSALNLDGIASPKFLRMLNVKLEAPATGYGMTVKNMLSPRAVYMENIECNGRAWLEALRLNGHGIYILSILGGTPGLTLKDNVNLFMNDCFSVTAGGTSVFIDGSTNTELHSLVCQSIGGSGDVFHVINGSTMQVSDLRIVNGGSGQDIVVDDSTVDVLTGRYFKNKVTLIGTGSIGLLTPASRINNDSTVTGATVEDALDTLETGKEDAFAKNTAFNKNFGFTSADVPRGDLVEQLANKDQVSGYAGLDGSGKINPSQLPAIAISDTFVVGSQAAMLALTAQTGDVAIRTDLPDTYILRGTDPSVLGDWEILRHPADAVSSVFTRTGVVTAQSGDYSANQVINTPSGAIASTDVQGAINELDTEKEPVFSKNTGFNKNFGSAVGTVCEGDHRGTVTGNPHVVTKTEVGLGNVTNDAQLKAANNDFGSFTQKFGANKADRFLQEDSADSNNKKYIELQHMMTGVGAQLIAMKTLTYADAGSGTVITNPAAGKLIVTGMIIEVETAFDGTTPVLDIGDGNDPDGFMEQADIDLTTPGKYGEIHSDRGAYLWNTGTTSSRTFLYTGADTIDYALTIGGTPTQGELVIYLLGSYAGYIQDEAV